MTVKIKLDLYKLVNTTFTLSSGIAFSELADKENFASAYAEATTIIITQSANSKSINVSGIALLQNDDRLNLSASSDYVIFSGWFNEAVALPQFLQLLELEIITIITDETLLYLYRLNDKKEAVDKDLILVNFMIGNFKAPLGIKNIEIDVLNYNIDNSYNYVYIPKLKRYYYITNIQFINKDYTRLLLQEDVLMSWKDLIEEQSVFVTRYENATNLLLVDNRRPLEDVMTVEYTTFDQTSSGSLVNTTFDFNLASTVYCFMVTSISSYPMVTRTTVSTPTGTDLPSINNCLNDCDWVSFLTEDQASTFYQSLFEDSPTASYINSVVLLPFNPYLDNKPYDDFENSVLYAGDKVLTTSGFYDLDHIPSGSTVVTVKRSKKGASPYFIVYDFTFTVGNYFYDREPYRNAELFIPFVGWVQIQIKHIANYRCIVYYTIDHITGSGTAYLYNVTLQKLIWSSNCQLGLKMNLTTSNALEIERQKEASQLNLIMGLLTSAVSIGVGVMAENPVAIAGGVLSGGKAIATAVNVNNQLFQRAQTNFGTGEGAMHSPIPNKINVRFTRNRPLTLTSDATYRALSGLPYNNYTTLTGFTGYVEVGDIQFDAKGNNIYSDEINEIVQLLKSGVIF